MKLLCRRCHYKVSTTKVNSEDATTMQSSEGKLWRYPLQSNKKPLPVIHDAMKFIAKIVTCAMVKSRYIWGWSSHLLIGNPYNGYINPYGLGLMSLSPIIWNNGSLDPDTHAVFSAPKVPHVRIYPSTISQPWCCQLLDPQSSNQQVAPKQFFSRQKKRCPSMQVS